MSASATHPKLYLIPGLGADHRLFDGLREEGLQFEVLDFILPKPKESLSDYAIRLAEGIDTDQPYMIGGVSLGGLMSVEIAHRMQPEKVFLISSVKNSREIPFYFRLMRYIPLHRLFSGEFFKKYAPKDSRSGIEQWKVDVLAQMRTDADARFVKWAVNAVVTWKQPVTPSKSVHIHGTRDLMFPGVMLGPRIQIPRGSHIMVLSKSQTVAEELKKHL